MNRRISWCDNGQACMRYRIVYRKWIASGTRTSSAWLTLM